jgi:hypothetical protein
MIGWNTDMSQAPKGDTREITLPHNGAQKTIIAKQPLILSVNGQVITSFWSDARNQWSGVASGQVPDAWMSWPDPYRAGT